MKNSVVLGLTVFAYASSLITSSLLEACLGLCGSITPFHCFDSRHFVEGKVSGHCLLSTDLTVVSKSAETWSGQRRPFMLTAWKDLLRKKESQSAIKVKPGEQVGGGAVKAISRKYAFPKSANTVVTKSANI